MIRRPPRSTLFPYTTALPILDERPAGPHAGVEGGELVVADRDHRAEVLLRSEEHTSELQSRQYLVCRLLLEEKSVRWAGDRSRAVQKHRTAHAFPAADPVQRR